MVPILVNFRLTYPNASEAKAALGDCTYSSDDGQLTIRFSDSSTKWYDSYESVKALTALYNAFKETAETEASDINGGFMRIGEEDTDIESYHYGADPYDLVQLNRSIEIDCGEGGSIEAVLGAPT